MEAEISYDDDGKNDVDEVSVSDVVEEDSKTV